MIVTSPEMAIENPSFRKLFVQPSFSKTVAAIVIDECHLITTWGDQFRMAYGKLKYLRSYVGTHTPFLAVSATLTKEARFQVATALQMDRPHTFYLNLGNDKPNIKWEVKRMTYPVNEFNDLDFIVNGDNRHPNGSLKKTMVFANEISTTHRIAYHLRSLLPPSQHHLVQFYHAQRSRRSKEIVMEQFVRGEVLILVATEAAGMVSVPIPIYFH